MAGIIELDELLKTMSPTLMMGDYVFCTVERSYSELIELEPLATFKEAEGITLILPLEVAITEGFKFEGIFKQITLLVHSSLDAVGLTAAISSKLTESNISANVVAAYYHDHVFVPKDKANEAMSALGALTKSSK
jgi:hypothetical protein